MKFVYNGTTWTCSNAEYPNYPVTLGKITDADNRRTWEGSARKNTNWNKDTYGLKWNNCGSSVYDHVKTWPYLDGDIVFYSSYGTATCKALASSYSFEETSKDNYSGGITLEQV